LLRHERAIVAGALLLITVLAWAALLQGAGTGMSVTAMTTWRFPPPRVAPAAGAWDTAYWLTMLAMWWVMMVAMMVPSAAPMILLHARVAGAAPREHAGTQAALGSSAAFTAGYLACWLGFSALAVALQFALERLGLLDGMTMWSVNRWLTGGLLIAAAVYQLSPIKQACLGHCRSPAAFLAQHRRPGAAGAFRLGLVHGSYCLGCCWVLMLLLFAAGIMNLVWIVGLALLVLVEKLVPVGRQLAPVTAALLAAAGVYAIVGA
jgi:predicted metal-binding membrane protein